MHDGSFDIPSVSTNTTRQQFIADTLKKILPQIEKKKRFAYHYDLRFVTIVFIIAFMAGYSFCESIRELNASQKKIIQALLIHTSTQQHISPDKVEAYLLTQLKVEKLDNIRNYQWEKALSTLGQYVK